LHHARFHRLQARSKSKNCIEQELKLVVIGNDDVALTHSDNDDDDNNNNNNDDDDDDDEKEGRRTAIGPKDGSAGKARSRTNASWSEEELADGAKASAKYYSENNTSKKRKPEQEAGVFEIFEKTYKARTENDTQRSSNGLSQKMDVVFGQMKDANGHI